MTVALANTCILTFLPNLGTSDTSSSSGVTETGVRLPLGVRGPMHPLPRAKRDRPISNCTRCPGRRVPAASGSLAPTIRFCCHVARFAGSILSILSARQGKSHVQNFFYSTSIDFFSYIGTEHYAKRIRPQMLTPTDFDLEKDDRADRFYWICFTTT